LLEHDLFRPAFARRSVKPNDGRPLGSRRRETGTHPELHLTKAHNWLVAWCSLSDPVDPSTARVCDAVMRAFDDQRRRLHARAA
jgi:hypothetical protein